MHTTTAANREVDNVPIPAARKPTRRSKTQVTEPESQPSGAQLEVAPAPPQPMPIPTKTWKSAAKKVQLPVQAVSNNAAPEPDMETDQPLGRTRTRTQGSRRQGKEKA